MIIPALTQPPLGAWAAKRKPGQPGTHPRYGVTTWFRVVVLRPTGQEDLGRWSGCSGLGVDLNVEEVWSGGENDAPYLIPKNITHGRLTLERAMNHADSERVQLWLRHVARHWHDGDEGGAGLVESGGTAKASYTGSTVVISLFSSPGGEEQDRLLGSWELAGAFPIAWSAPPLTSRSGGVAIERLTLAHRGFLGGGSLGHQESARSDQAPGRFTLTDEQHFKLEFQYNPGEVTQEKKLEGSTNQGVGNGTDLWRATNKICYDVTALTIEGATAVKEKAAKLWEWLEPEHGVGQATAKRLVMAMGTDYTAQVHLRSVKIRYTRFTRAGVPCRAVATLTVVGASEERAKPGGSTPVGAPAGGGRSPKGGARGGPRPPGRSATADDLPARGSADEDTSLRSLRKNAGSFKDRSR
ncbi:phage tail protein [Umezawaea endophytica]|uniref:Phage tail protein n=1 Tax=Umezawaea endophytica TaxID=1654476 RepID=A0A9X2VI72_9PSEU|nr:phage tail protein [Umezawaea endophytica]MCS7477115.1 phage tail protein [Umezawaea endophytica]